jgi:hypothetical protein
LQLAGMNIAGVFPGNFGTKYYLLGGDAMRINWLCKLCGIAFLFSSIMACGGGSGTDGNTDCPSGKCDNITPEGKAGYLTVKEPVLGDDVEVVPYLMSFGGKTIKAGDKTKFVVGKDCLVISVQGGTQNIRDCEITIENKVETVYQLAAIVVTKNTDAFVTEVGPRPKATIYQYLVQNNQEKLFSTDFNTGYLDVNFQKNQKAFMLPVGKFSINFSPAVLVLMNTPAKSYDQGQVENFDLTPSQEYRATAMIKAPARSLTPPKEVVGTSAQIDRHYVTLRNCQPGSDCSGYSEPFVSKTYTNNRDLVGVNFACQYNYFVDLYIFDLAQDTPVRMYPIVPEVDGAKLHYEFVTNNTSYVIKPESGKTIEVEGQHLDLNDIEIEPNPGEIQKIQAIYSIYYKHLDHTDASWQLFDPIKDQSWTSPCVGTFDKTSYSTSSGFDLAPAHYRIVFDYSINNKGQRQTFECDLVTPSISGQDRCIEVAN